MPLFGIFKEISGIQLIYVLVGVFARQSVKYCDGIFALIMNDVSSGNSENIIVLIPQERC